MRVKSVRSEWKLDFCGGIHFYSIRMIALKCKYFVGMLEIHLHFTTLCAHVRLRLPNVILICLILGDFQLNSLHYSYR